MARTRR